MHPAFLKYTDFKIKYKRWRGIQGVEKALQSSFMKESKRELIFYAKSRPNAQLQHIFVQNVAEKTKWRKATTAARKEHFWIQWEDRKEQSAVQTLLLLTFYLKRKPGKPAHYKNDSDQMQRTHPARGTGCEELIYKEDGLGSLLPHPRIFDSDCLNRLFLFFSLFF